MLPLLSILNSTITHLVPLFHPRDLSRSSLPSSSLVCKVVGENPCGDFCLPADYKCCPTEQGGCVTGFACALGHNDEYGCCPLGAHCLGDGGVQILTVTRTVTAYGGGGDWEGTKTSVLAVTTSTELVMAETEVVVKEEEEEEEEEEKLVEEIFVADEGKKEDYEQQEKDEKEEEEKEMKEGKGETEIEGEKEMEENKVEEEKVEEEKVEEEKVEEEEAEKEKENKAEEKKEEEQNGKQDIMKEMNPEVLTRKSSSPSLSSSSSSFSLTSLSLGEGATRLATPPIINGVVKAVEEQRDSTILILVVGVLVILIT